jgi:hypothetical protein
MARGYLLGPRQSKLTGNSPSSGSIGSVAAGNLAVSEAAFLRRAGLRGIFAGLWTGCASSVSAGGNAGPASNSRSRRNSLAAGTRRACGTCGSKLSSEVASCSMTVASKPLPRSVSSIKPDLLWAGLGITATYPWDSSRLTRIWIFCRESARVRAMSVVPSDPEYAGCSSPLEGNCPAEASEPWSFSVDWPVRRPLPAEFRGWRGLPVMSRWGWGVWERHPLGGWKW